MTATTAFEALGMSTSIPSIRALPEATVTWSVASVGSIVRAYSD
jgi:hypothetical protein